MDTPKLHPLFYKLSPRQKVLVEILVSLSTMSVAMGQTIVFTVLQPVGRELGLLAIHTGFIIVASSVIFATGNNIWGRQSERWGRKAIIILGLLGYTAGTLIFTSVFILGFKALLTGAWLIVCLTLARMLQSTLMSAAPPAATAYIADITDYKTRTPAMARVGTANSLGTILGPAVAGLLAGISLLAPLYFAASLTFVAALLIIFWLPFHRDKDAKQKVIAKVGYFDPRIRNYVMLGILMFVSFAAMQMTFGFYLQDMLQLDAANTIKTMGWLSMISAIASMSSQWGLANFLKLPPLWLIRLGFPLLLIGMTCLLLATGFSTMAFAMVFIGLGMGIIGPGYSAAASLQVSSEEQGAVAGIVSSCPAIGFIFGPLIGPTLYQWDHQWPLMFTVCLLSCLTLFALFRLKAPGQ